MGRLSFSLREAQKGHFSQITHTEGGGAGMWISDFPLPAGQPTRHKCLDTWAFVGLLQFYFLPNIMDTQDPINKDSS